MNSKHTVYLQCRIRLEIKLHTTEFPQDAETNIFVYLFPKPALQYYPIGDQKCSNKGIFTADRDQNCQPSTTFWNQGMCDVAHKAKCRHSRVEKLPSNQKAAEDFISLITPRRFTSLFVNNCLYSESICQ